MSDKPTGKIKSVYFLHAVTPQQALSLTVGKSPSGASGTEVLVLEPALLTFDGDWAAIDKGQRAEGIGIKRRVFVNGAWHVERTFVPMWNVHELRYGE